MKAKIIRYAIIVGLAAVAGGLTKAADMAGTLDMPASTTAYLVAVITATVALIGDYINKFER